MLLKVKIQQLQGLQQGVRLETRACEEWWKSTMLFLRNEKCKQKCKGIWWIGLKAQPYNIQVRHQYGVPRIMNQEYIIEIHHIFDDGM